MYSWWYIIAYCVYYVLNLSHGCESKCTDRSIRPDFRGSIHTRICANPDSLMLVSYGCLLLIQGFNKFGSCSQGHSMPTHTLKLKCSTCWLNPQSIDMKVSFPKLLRHPLKIIQVIRPFQYWNLWWLGDPPFWELFHVYCTNYRYPLIVQRSYGKSPCFI